MKSLRICLISALITIAHASPEVLSISPASHSMGHPLNGEIVIDFTTAIDTASINDTTFMVFGRWSGVMSGTVSYEADATRLRFTPSGQFSAGEWVNVALSKGLMDSEGDSLEYGYTWSFWTTVDPGRMEVEILETIPVREPGEGWIQTYGANAADLNHDGYTDYTVPNERSNDVRVFMNDGAGNYDEFTIFSLPDADRPSTNESADFNLDGHIDIAVGSTTNSTVNVLLGDGTGGFISMLNYDAGTEVRGLTVLDLNGDGFSDIVTANRVASTLSLLMNNGDGTFADPIDVSTSGLSGETAIAAADANNDGIFDLFVGSRNTDNIAVFLGDGNGNVNFTSEVDAGGLRPWMLAVGDVNGDGNVDVATANSSSNNVGVLLGDGAGGLSPSVTYNSGNGFPLALDFGDLDGDGDLEMMVSNFSGSWRLWENDGDGNFINAQDFDASAAASCAVFHDRDADGDMDITGIDELDDMLFIFGQVPTDTDETSQEIKTFGLLQNYPNPFNPNTVINLQLAHASEIELAIYNVNGQLVQQLANGSQLAAGQHSFNWDGTNRSGSLLPSGVYFYRLTVLDHESSTKSFSQTRKMLLIR